MAANVAEFPRRSSPIPTGFPNPQVNVLSVPSATGQAKQLPAILGEMGAHGIETAVVLPDETQLLPVLNSIPRHISDINVTMGCPMNTSGLWSLMNNVAALQMHLRQKDGSGISTGRRYGPCSPTASSAPPRTRRTPQPRRKCARTPATTSARPAFAYRALPAGLPGRGQESRCGRRGGRQAAAGLPARNHQRTCPEAYVRRRHGPGT